MCYSQVYLSTQNVSNCVCNLFVVPARALLDESTYSRSNRMKGTKYTRRCLIYCCIFSPSFSLINNKNLCLLPSSYAENMFTLHRKENAASIAFVSRVRNEISTMRHCCTCFERIRMIDIPINGSSCTTRGEPLWAKNCVPLRFKSHTSAKQNS